MRIIENLNHALPADCPFATIWPRQVATLYDIVDEDQWRASDFYREASRSDDISDVLCLEIRLKDSSIYHVRFTRNQGRPRFGQEERRLAQLLLPHLSRAFEMAREKAFSEVIHNCYVQACDRLGVGAFILDKKGRVLEQNHAANELLSTSESLLLVGAQLRAADASEDGVLQRAIRSVVGNHPDASSELLSLRGLGPASIGVTIRRIHDAGTVRAGARRPVAIMFVRDSEFRFEAEAQAAQSLFDLTPSEAQLLMRLANGLSLLEAAEDLHVRHTTARTHLRSIFGKTGISRQSALVRRVLNSVALLAVADKGAKQVH